MNRIFNESNVGDKVAVEISGEMVSGKITTICRMSDLNPGRDLVEVYLDGFGYEVFDAKYIISNEIHRSMSTPEPVRNSAYRPKHPGELHFDDIESGMGIGGVGSDDYNMSTEADRGYRQSGHKCGGGQRYDEECAGCGRVTAICNDCELCEKCHE